MHCVQLVSAACPAIAVAVAVAVFVAVAFYANVRYVLLTKRIKRLHKSVQQPSILQERSPSVSRSLSMSPHPSLGWSLAAKRARMPYPYR